MSIRRVSPREARELIEEQGYVYVDVRSVPEFERGHPEGAYNVPIAHLGPAGMAPNPDFTAVMEARFPRDARLVLGCQAGGRSLQAAGLLQSLGYADVVDQRAGWGGTPAEPGWAAQGLPAATEAEAGRDWDALAKDKGE
jgi:rhodanese-related sulfurtransferase